ncbi:MAG: hypothetical protein HND47_24955 [Chloroflexi bacterium]|nr:hypothetical protein [Chloroflexota bacterium]
MTIPGMADGTPTPRQHDDGKPRSGSYDGAVTAPNVQPATEADGGQPLEYRTEDGVKVFELTTKAVQWEILDGVTVTAFTYNGTVPGPDVSALRKVIRFG